MTPGMQWYHDYEAFYLWLLCIRCWGEERGKSHAFVDAVAGGLGC